MPLLRSWGVSLPISRFARRTCRRGARRFSVPRSVSVREGRVRSNQTVAGARLGARVSFISKLGNDPFGELARRTCANEGIDARFVFESDDATGGASIVVDEVSGENAIVVVPGACFHLRDDEIDAAREAIQSAGVFMTQIEQALETVEYGLRTARSLGVATILNPAPGQHLADSIYRLCDYVTPNESEAAIVAGQPVADLAGARRVARSS